MALQALNHLLLTPNHALRALIASRFASRDKREINEGL